MTAFSVRSASSALSVLLRQSQPHGSTPLGATRGSAGMDFACRTQGRISAEVPESAELAEKEAIGASRKVQEGTSFFVFVW